MLPAISGLVPAAGFISIGSLQVVIARKARGLSQTKKTASRGTLPEITVFAHCCGPAHCGRFADSPPAVAGG
jgi:hypothetical protein